MTSYPDCNTIYYMSSQRVIKSFSLSPEIVKQLEILAREENKTKSELLREAVRLYKWRRDWAKIRMWGEETARRMGIETYDEIEKIAG